MEVLFNIFCFWVIWVCVMDSEKHYARRRQERDGEVQ
jgi:hypothetical protein